MRTVRSPCSIEFGDDVFEHFGFGTDPDALGHRQR
jgi:hypothetical protein